MGIVISYNSFVEIWLTYSTLHISRVYNLLGFDMCTLVKTILTIKLVSIAITTKSFIGSLCLPFLPVCLSPILKQLLICFISLYISFHFLGFTETVLYSILFLVWPYFSPHNHFEIHQLYCMYHLFTPF